MKEISLYLEDYQIGSTRISSGRTITETDVVVHAGHSGDFFPHHMDAVFCATQPFEKRIAHGTMTFAIGIGLTASEINPLAMTYGYERLRFPNPVYIGDTIHTELEITNIQEQTKREGYGLVSETCRVINQNGEVVLFCEHLLLVKKKL